MLEFTTDLKAKTEEQEAVEADVIEFKVDGQILRAYPPTASQIAVAVAGTGKRVPFERKIQTVVDFFVRILDDEDAAYVTERLLDRSDPFGLEQIEQIMKGLMEEWSARPTQPSSDSSATPPTTGSSSTEATPQSTSSTSALVSS